jgi:hypothetical protein
LRVQRTGHINAFVIVIRTFEADIFRGAIRADSIQERRKRRTTPTPDRTPAFHADMARDLFYVWQGVKLA